MAEWQGYAVVKTTYVGVPLYACYHFNIKFVDPEVKEVKLQNLGQVSL